MSSEAARIAVVGDVHGHLQLALCVVARWQIELGLQFDAVLLCGDVGTFTSEEQLDNATRSHGRDNPCELEFLRQWAPSPPAPWLDFIFRPVSEEGLGLLCPVIMVHGNHEGFSHLADLTSETIPDRPVTPSGLPAVDAGSHVRLLPSGWRVAIPDRITIAGLGGVEEGQRTAAYPRMAYLDDDAVSRVIDSADDVDILISHQGPARTQGAGGSTVLDLILSEEPELIWFHGHTVNDPAIAEFGPTKVVPLGDIAFAGKDGADALPGPDGWARAELTSQGTVVCRETPVFLREFRRRRWTERPDGLLISPTLQHLAFRFASWPN